MRSKVVQNILDNITKEQNKEFEREWLEAEAHHRWMEENGLEYCTNTSPSLITLKEHGFHPIAITSFYLEETFIFHTKKEAKKAYKKLEKELGEIIGWWYSEKDFKKELEQATQKGEYYENGHLKIYKTERKTH